MHLPHSGIVISDTATHKQYLTIIIPLAREIFLSRPTCAESLALISCPMIALRQSEKAVDVSYSMPCVSFSCNIMVGKHEQ